jgi:hypothetical protein
MEPVSQVLAQTTQPRFVFEMSVDLYDFHLCVSPEGLSRVGGLIIALGQIDWPGSGPFFSIDNDLPMVRWMSGRRPSMASRG